MTTARRVLLVDNGSLEPASTLQLRRIAQMLAARLGGPVEPVSLAHADKIPVAALGGIPAELFEAGLARVLREGADAVTVVPLFIGPSHAIVRWLPAMVETQVKLFPEATVRIAAPLFADAEERLAGIVADHARERIAPGVRPRVAVVDHGSPARGVTEARDAVATQVRALLGDAVIEVAACSMERREGVEFDFNEPLLARLLVRDDWRTGPLIVALLFIAPGLHAGPGGDVAEIVRAARGGDLGGVSFTRVLGESPQLVEILADRVCRADG